MIELEKIPHIHEISNHGPYHGAREKNTATFQARSTRQNKLVPSLEEAIRRTGLKDGMTISFHHHFRNGDHIINTVVDKLAEMGYKNLTLAASSLAAVHAPLIRHIQNGVITHIETSGMRGELAEQVSRGLIDCPVVFRSHGGRASAIRSGDLHIDVAFLGAPSCDPYGNANGYSRDDEDGIACGSLGYARTDATYADNVIVITNHLVAYPNAPWAIPEFEVDYVVMTDDIGDPKGIMSGATRYTKDPKELLIAKTAANVIEAAGYLYDGFSMQMGSGGASLATARFLRQKMIDQNIHCRFALGGITGQNSLGLAAYMGLGAYVCCLVVTKTGMNPWVAAVLDMLVVGVVAGVIFFPSLILRGPYFTLVSIAFAESIRQFIINSEFFGRASGVGLPFGKDSFAQFRFTSKVPYYYIGFIMMVGVYLIMKKIGRSKLGFALRTIREDEDAAAAIGINPTKYKVIAVVISAIIAGLVGFFYVSYIRYIDPDIMIQSKSTEIVLPAVVGGAAYIEGPLIGGLIMIPLSELLRANFAAILPGINMLMYAIVLIVVIRFRPSGILGWYMNSKVKTFIDEKILKKPSLDVLEEYELMADKGGK